jgi:hypothetical protein
MSSLPTLLVAGRLRLADTTDTPAEGLTPIDYITKWCKDRMPEFGGRTASMADRVLIVRAETGSGKSTVLPVALFRILRSKDAPAGVKYRGPGVICTQPRVLTAIALSADVSAPHSPWNPDMIEGETVGFQTGPVSNRPRAGLIFATAGVLAVQLRAQEDSEIMGRYRFIIVDEVHERSLDGDMLMASLKGFYGRNVGNERLPFLILASATINPARYAEYFGVGSENVVEVIGRQYPIETTWPAQGTNNYPREAAEVAARIHESHPDDAASRADIMIFVPGALESTLVNTYLFKANRKWIEEEKGIAPMLILTINREVVISQTGDYPLVFEKPERLPLVGGRVPLRRVIIATVVAETGLTIDTLKYLIDAGWNRAREVYPPWLVEGVVTRPAARSRIQQRKGRVGRLFPGEFYPLYTQNVFDALDEQQLPEIVLVGPADIFLAIIREQQRQKLRLGAASPEFALEDLTLLDPPAPEAFAAANAIATAAGLVSLTAPLPDRWPVPVGATPGPLAARGYGLTQLGHIAAAFSRVSMEGARVLLAGLAWGVAASDLATAVAMFGSPLSSLLTTEERGLVNKQLPPGANALRAALPSYFTSRHGGGVASPPSESEMFYFRARLLIADDFAEAALIFDAFMRRLDSAQGDIAGVADWCEGIGLDFDALIDLARRRDQVIEEMIGAGLDPFRDASERLSTLTVERFVPGLSAFKRCLYDGLRTRLVRWRATHPEGAGYYTLQGGRVKTPDFLSDAMANRLRALRGARVAATDWKPLWLLTDTIRMKPAPQRAEDFAPPLLYVAETNLVSILDGFVDPDIDFTAPRTFP